MRAVLGASLALVLGGAGCETSAPPAPSARPSASAVPLYVPPPPEGCARAGSLEGVEADPACVVPHGDETAMRDAMKQLAFALVPDATTVTAGGTMLLRLAIANGGPSEAVVVLDAQLPGAVPRPDWTRLAGVPEPRPVGSGAPPPEGYRLIMPVRTLDAHEHAVDGLPSTTSTAGATPAPPSTRFLRVRLRPGAKLTHIFTWWALRIPAPAPITRDDAGHRFVPKTAPIPLPTGEYVVNVELPLHGISVPESIVTTRLRVEKPDASP